MNDSRLFNSNIRIGTYLDQTGNYVLKTCCQKFDLCMRFRLKPPKVNTLDIVEHNIKFLVIQPRFRVKVMLYRPWMSMKNKKVTYALRTQKVDILYLMSADGKIQ